MYLMIQNPGVCPIDGFLVLGLSGTRGNTTEGLIGQFGSGNKHATNLLLRQGLNPVVFCGLTELSFFTKPVVMDDELNPVNYNRVFVAIREDTEDGANEIRDLNTCLEYGALDWDSISMALREYVSNALDRTMKEFGVPRHPDLKLDVVSEATPVEGKTRVFIPLTPEVQRYYSELNQNFLHFTNREKCKVLSKSGASDARIFRNGVFVREHGPESLFDYNLGNEVKIDESRTMDSYTARHFVKQHIMNHATVNQLMRIIQMAVSDENKFERDIGWITYTPGTDRIILIRQVWENLYGPDAVLINNSSLLSDMVKRKGYRPINMPQDGWFNTLKQCGIPTALDVLDQCELEGMEILDATEAVEEALDYVWPKLPRSDMMQQPNVKCFRKMMNAESIRQGYYRDGTIFVNIEYADKFCRNLVVIVLEEAVHYITKATDNSRDFQEYLIQCLVTMWEDKDSKITCENMVS